MIEEQLSHTCRAPAHATDASFHAGLSCRPRAHHARAPVAGRAPHPPRRSATATRYRAEFSEHITLAAHQKAADYTAAQDAPGHGRHGRRRADSARLHPRRRRCRRLLRRWAQLFDAGSYAHGIALIVSVALICGRCRPAVRALPHLRDRGALRLQPHDPAPVLRSTWPSRPCSALRWACRSPSACCG